MSNYTGLWTGIPNQANELYGATGDITKIRARLEEIRSTLLGSIDLASISITGGTISGTPISGSTGSFTTLAASSTLAVTGAATFSSTVALSDAATIATDKKFYLRNTASYLYSPSANNLTVTTAGILALNATTFTLTGALGLTGAATISSTLGVTGAATLGSAVITGSATVGTTLGVTGVSTLASAVITGAATVGTTLGVTGVSTLASAVITGAATVGTTLGVTGVSTLASAIVTAGITVGTTLEVTGESTLTGDTTIEGDLTVNGSVIFSDSVYPILSGCLVLFNNASSIFVQQGFATINDKIYRIYDSANTNGRIELVAGQTFANSDINYIYLDETDATLSVIDGFRISVTAPTWNHARQYWEGSDETSRCVGMVYVDGSGNVTDFHYDGEYYQYQSSTLEAIDQTIETAYEELATVPSCASFAQSYISILTQEDGQGDGLISVGTASTNVVTCNHGNGGSNNTSDTGFGARLPITPGTLDDTKGRFYKLYAGSDVTSAWNIVGFFFNAGRYAQHV